MSRQQHDYADLRKQYVSTPGLSIRELCKRNEIKGYSTVNQVKNREEWDKLRESFQTQLAEGEVGKLVTARLQLVADIHEELLLAVRHAVRRFIADVSAATDPQPVSARDLMGMIDKFLLLSGSTPHRTESRNLDAHSFTFDGLFEGAPPDLLQQLAELAGERGSQQQPVGRGALVVLEGVG